jgi:hypothetical protein
MAVILMIAFARSGGTVLNKCLGSLPDVLMLSEVNPLGGGWGLDLEQSATSVKAQAKEWYQIALRSDDYLEGILELEKICLQDGKNLVIRDWTYINYFPDQANDYHPPEKLLAYDSLNPHCDLIPFVFVRDSIDVWISRGLPSAKSFFKHYLNYIEDVVEFPSYKYEDFCEKPGQVIREICHQTGLPYDESWKNYQDYQNVHGDVQTNILSRGRRMGGINPLPRKLISPNKIKEVNQNSDMKKANQHHSYPEHYQGRKRESVLEYIMDKIKRSRYLDWS